MITLKSVSGLLEKGYQHFDRFQYGDALGYFAEALRIEPGSEEARAGCNQVIQAIVPRWHFNMLNDRWRNESYDAAIRNTVDETGTVLDIGSGSGLLAMMAARAGAKMTYSCEMNTTIADLAKRIVSANGYGEGVKIIGKKSSDLLLGVDLPERVDVLITETLDSGLLGEGILPIIIDARERLLVENAKIIPRGAKIYGALLDSQKIWDLNYVNMAAGFDVGLFNTFSTAGSFPVRLERFPHKFLTEAVEVCEFDFMYGSLEPRKFKIPLTTVQSGLCHAVAYWFDLYLDDKVCYSTSPLNSSSHWKQAIYPFASPVALEADQNLILSAQQELTRIDFQVEI
jgi:type II protein arginine methyltransferase